MPDFQAEWKNWGRNIDIRPRQIFVPNTLKELSDFIKQANQDDRRLRVLGSGWSFNDVAVSHDDLVDLSGWNRVLAFSQGLSVWGHELPGEVPGGSSFHPPESPVLIAALLPQVTDSGRRFAHVLAGTNLKWLYLALDNPLGDDPAGTRDRWGLMTMGGSAGQTVAGLVSTSTHGADFDLAPPADFVRAIDLIAPDGTRHWFERAVPNSITDPNKLPNVFQNDPPTPIAHYNDDEFFAVLVSMGCMGIMRSVILEVAPQFGLSQRVGTSTWETLKPLLKGGVLFTKLPPWNGVKPTGSMPAHPPVAPPPVARALEIFINPYRISNDYFNDPAPDRACLVTSRAESSQVDKPEPGGGGPCFLDLVTDLQKINAFKENDATAAGGIITGLMGGLRPDTKSFPYPVYYSVLDGGGDDKPVLSVEFAVPTINDLYITFIDGMLDRFDKLVQSNLDKKLAGAFSLRFTQSSDAFLAIQNFFPIPTDVPTRICHIELLVAHHVDMLGNRINEDEDIVGLPNPNEMESSSAEHVARFEELASQLGIHMHWGQLSLTNHHDPQRYGNFQTWQKVREQLTQSGKLRAFDSDFTVRYGISPGAPNWQPVSRSLLPGSPTMAPRSANDSKVFPPTALRDTSQCLELVVVGTDGQACWNRQAFPNSDFVRWSFVEIPDVSGNARSSSVFGGRIAVGTNQDGHPEIFVRDRADNKIYHAWRTKATDHKWHSWVRLKDDNQFFFDRSPDVATDADGHLQVVALSKQAHVSRVVQDQPFSGWGDWTDLNSSSQQTPFVGAPCIVVNRDRSLEVFERDKAGFIWHTKQKNPSSGADWSDWAKLGASAVGGDPGAGRNDDGTLEVFARGIAGAPLHMRQSSPGDWTGAPDWTTLPNSSVALAPKGRPSVILSRKNLQVAVLASDPPETIVHFDQNGGQWQQNILGGPFTSWPSIAENEDHRLEIFAKFENDFVEHRFQDTNFQWT